MIARLVLRARPAFQPCGALCRLRPVARDLPRGDIEPVPHTATETSRVSSRPRPRRVVRIDPSAAPGGATEVRGAQTWAGGAIGFSRGARFARPAMVNGAVGVVAAPRGRLFRVLSFTFADGKIVRVDVIGDPARLQQLELAVLDNRRGLRILGHSFIPFQVAQELPLANVRSLGHDGPADIEANPFHSASVERLRPRVSTCRGR